MATSASASGVLTALLLLLGGAADAAPLSTATASTATVAGATARPGEARGLAEDGGVDPEDVVLFVPRLVLTPVRWVLAGVFWPLRQAAILTEEHRLVEHTIDLLYNDARTAGVLPILLGVPGAGLSGGATIFHNDLFGHGESLSLSGRFGGLFNYSVSTSFSADRLGGTRLWLQSDVRVEANPNLYFFGIGDPDEVDAGTGGLDPRAGAVETRYSQERILGRFRVGGTLGHPGAIVQPGVSVVYNRRRFGPADRLSSDERSLETVYDAEEVPGFSGGADTVEVTADLVLDYRTSPGLTTSGVYMEAFVGGAPPQGDWRFFHWGAELSGYLDLYQGNRVLVLRAAIDAVESDAGRTPFTSLPRLGGPNRLRGYRIDTFRDEKASLFTLEYRYPIHRQLSGFVFADAGHVADDYLNLFNVTQMKVGYGGGVLVGTPDSVWLQVDLSYGDAFRVFVSTNPLEAFSDRTETL